MNGGIAIVGISCEYPDASTPEELWLNALAQRRSFRRIPRERLDLDQYWSNDRSESDLTYCSEAALLKNYTFDRLHFNISGPTFRATDFTHWLALDTAERAWRDAMLDDEIARLRDKTGVFVGNSLAGEFSRSGSLRVRWPFVKNVIQNQLDESWSDKETAMFLRRCESDYKSHFEPFSEDTLPGGLANTIAGRICNFFDFKGGGYVVDGACSSSLLAIINGCSALLSRDLDIAVCGGVDLSLDPFELVGFARNGALAAGEMRIFDKNPTGFLPGEGSGFVVLLREEDARDRGKRIHAIIRGWGISSDGKGGMTRPEPQGQLLALKRAYEKAGLKPSDAAYFEAHGTGTAAGDVAELTALCDAICDGKSGGAAVGSIKANIGHTKAASGIAGLLKTVMALKSETIPPTTGSIDPHSILERNSDLLHVQSEACSWPSNRNLVAGVSAMGFGGINAHLVLQGVSDMRASMREAIQSASISSQDAELFVLSGTTEAHLQTELGRLLSLTDSLSHGELVDLSAHLIHSNRTLPFRAAVVARSPGELGTKLQKLLDSLGKGSTYEMMFEEGIFLSNRFHQLRICLLFPGQGTPYLKGDWPFYRRIAGQAPIACPISASHDASETERDQCGISLQCVRQLRILEALGIDAMSSVGHSLGELIALHWAGVISEAQLLEYASIRGRFMDYAARRSSQGAMVAVKATASEVGCFLSESVAVAALNGSHIVLSGPLVHISEIEHAFQSAGIRCFRLPVQYAFHSQAFMPAAESFKRELSSRTFQPATRRVFSTVTGSLFRADTDVASHLAKQIINPVLFEEAANQAAQESDLFLDLGSEGVLAGMIAAVSRHPVIVWNPRSAKGILQLAAALFVNGSPVDLQRLSQFRYVRNFSLDGPAEFLRNPCSAVNSVPQRRNMQRTDLPSARMSNNARLRPEETRTHSIESAGSRVSPVNTLLKIVSRKTELPQTQLSSSMNLLSDLHLSSIAVAEIAIEAAKSLGKKPLLMPTGAATMTIGELAVVLEESCEAAVAADEAPLVGGIDAWVGLAVVELNPVVRLQVKINSAKISDWTIRGATSPKAREIATAIAEKLTGDGVLLLYDASTSMDTVLRTAQEICQTPRHLLVVCDTSAPSISAFIRSLALEASSASIYLLKVDFSDESIQQIIIDSSWQTARFTECHFIEGKPFAPTLRFLPPSIGAEYLLESSDLMLVLGGGKGIAAECAFQIARKYGLSLALVGRSSPSGDEELDTNLSRLAEYGIRFRYWRADATDPIALSAVVREIEGELGSITAIMHAAGLNEPKSLATMTIADIERALLPKMQPLEILNGCLDFSSLKAFIAFGSIISRIGFHGEAHYAHSNEAMRERLEVLAKVHEKCRFLCLEWTVWSGLGMGKRLARLDRLTRDGIAPLTPEIGTAALIRLLESNIGATSVVITSRIPSLPTLKIQKTALRPSRFLERILINYPEIEFVAEAVLAIQKDLYLNDHKLDGAAIFPAALGLEAMTQAAIALFGGRIPTALLDVQFAIPITVGQDKGTTIRILALRRTAETAEIVIRSSQTDFQVDHFRAVCSIDPAGAAMSTNINPAAGKLLQIPELYDTILFQNGRFQIVSGYVEALAHRSCAVLSPTEQPWFSQFLPQSMSLINPSITDAAMHSIQACIPHRRLLPVSIDRMTTYPTANLGPPFRSRAIEICAKGSDFVYDVEITDQYGNGIQRMDGLRLHSISENDPSMFRTPQLIANMLERRWCELSDDGAQVFLHEEPEGGRSFERLPGRRADGKPIHIENAAVRAWSDGVLLQLLSSQDGACDIERVEHREPQMWRDLLGESLFQSAAFLAQRHGEEFDLATTRFWTIMECLKKLGRLSTGSVVSEQYTHEGWTLSRCGEYNIGTVPITLSGSHFVVAFAANSKRLPLTESEVTHALLRV